VVEAGGFYQVDNGNNSVVPYYAFTMGLLGLDEAYQRNPLMDWDLISEPEAGAGGRKIHYAQAKTLGGCSAINSMGYLRGTKGMHRKWAKMVGDETYLWEKVLPFFKRSCNLTPPNYSKRNEPDVQPAYDADVFGHGPLEVSFSNWIDPTARWLSEALQAIGLPVSPKGLSSGLLNGVSAWSSSTISAKDSTRESSQTSFLRQGIRKTTGLTIYPHTKAMKVNFALGRAISVSVATEGLEYTLSASQEVVISAGVYHSPQLLMVSGIGPRDELESKGIPIVSELPGVGQNLWDQIFFNVLSGMSTNTTAAIIAADPVRATKQYLQDGSGPFSYGGGFLAFEKIPKNLRTDFSPRTRKLLAEYPGDWPEIEYIVASFPGADGITLGAISGTLQVPISRGNVTLATASMADNPVIHLGWLTDPADGEVAVAALKRCRQAWAAGILGEFKVGDEVAPGAAAESDADILAYIRQTASTIWHASSTCSMGKSGDPNAVVDSQARVFGVDGLRVVDASAFPFSIPGHPSATVYMLAEKIAAAMKS